MKDATDQAEVLRKHNEWRRGADIQMLDPAEVGHVIDAVLLRLAMLEKYKRDMETKR